MFNPESHFLFNNVLPGCDVLAYSGLIPNHFLPCIPSQMFYRAPVISTGTKRELSAVLNLHRASLI